MNLLRVENANFENHTPSQVSRQKLTDKPLTEHYDPPSLSLDERGMILECSKAFEMLFGFRRHELAWQHISKLIPKLEGVELIQDGQFNPLLNYLCHCGHIYQILNQQGEAIISNLSFVRIEYEGKRTLKLIVRPSDKVVS